MPQQFCKKPVVIEAVQLRRDMPQADKVWLLTRPGVRITLHVDYAMIDTPEGPMKADHGDWVICGAKGEMYPCKPDIFQATYEEV